MVTHYDRWQSTYRSLEDFRITPIGISIGGSRTEQLKNCRNLGDDLSKHLNSWLNSESFRSLKEKLLKQLTPDDTVRVLIKTDNIWLRRLPWHLWDLFEDYSKAEVALSAPEYEKLPESNTTTSREKVKILAILGNSEGIFIEKDRQLLEKLPDAETTFLVEPKRSQLNEQLCEQDWDILFFAGHSSSQEDGKTGKICINQTDRLTIEELKYALKKAVSSGLQLAIFNSCDGLGLAHQLEDLHIPQIIVMREPVPDLVAQEFLKNFLSKFSGGESLYLAVRESRERLHGIEDEYPCAIWLPVICQNPATVPPTWEDLLKKPDLETDGSQPERHKARPQLRWRGLQNVLLASAIVTSLVMGVRSLGLLQSWELNAFDQSLRLRLDELPDQRLLVVTVTEADIQAQNQEQRKGSLSDVALARLLEKLESYQPRAIGLDIYRDFPVDPKYADLATRLRRSDRLIAVCKASDPKIAEPGVSPPPEIPTERLGFSDFIFDPDGILRRHLLALTPDPASPCTTPYAFSVQLAFRYLAADGILPKFTPDGFLQLGTVVFNPLAANTGGYQRVDAWGHQVLLNYRSHRSPQNIAAQVTLANVLNGQIDPNSIKDRIVLIGTTANSFRDYWLTPYSNSQRFDQQMPGVLVQAHMVSQILSAVLDGRSLLWVWPKWGEVLWIWGWSLIGGILAWRLRSPLHFWIAIVAGQISLYGFCFGLLVQTGCWVPLVPSALTLLATSGSVAAYTTVQARRQQIKSKFA
jgi:CHASE2 domain-containing sensor protein